MSYNRPGVYLTERLISRPIPAVGASNAAGACIGLFERGPEDVTLVTSWYEFSRRFGGYNAAFPATTSVAQFFRNGGSELFVRRVLTNNTDATGDKTVSFAAYGATATEVTLTTVGSTIVAGDSVTITGVPTLNGTYTVAAGTTATALKFPKVVLDATFTGYAVATNVVTITTAAAHGIAVGDSIVITGVTALNGTYVAGADTTGSTLKFPKTTADITVASGLTGVVTRAARTGLSGTAKVEGGFAVAVSATAAIRDSVNALIATVTVKDRGADGNSYRYEVTAASQAGFFDITFYREGKPSSPTPLVTSDDVIVERYTDVTFATPSSVNYAVDVINRESVLFSVSLAGNTSETETPDVTDGVVAFTGGTDGTLPTAAEVSAAIADFDEVTKPLVIFAPALFDSYSEANSATIQQAMISWADGGTGFAVLETAAGKIVSGATTAATALTKSSNAAVYYPHVYIQDPIGRTASSLRLVGPSAAMAGLYIQTDRNTGPYKTPAGLRSPLSGVVATERMFTNSDLDALHSNATPVNAIRDIPGVGVVPMGGRTLLQDGTANRHVAMRRSLIYIRHRLEQIAELALFEANDSRLWSRITTSMGVFLTEYFNQGGLRGNNTAEAYYVKCDEENNSTASIQNGEVHIEVGVALEYPAEFIVIALNQSTFE
jgi:phage tail sheath protein FI